MKSNAKGREPAPVRASETGRARNWAMPPLRLERECKERPNSATIDNRCEEFDRRESTESTAIIGLRALGRRIAFTMAEILLSLTIIGVVAAITLPSLTGNINERTWNTQRKALYARFSQAIALMPALNGYGTLTEDESGNVIEDTAAETFVTNGLSKVLKINNICDSEHLEDCGITSKMIDMNGSTISPLPTTLYDMNSKFAINADLWGEEVSILNTNSAAFETANGESILVFYNPYCRSDLANQGESARRSSMNCMCANFVYDLNGTKGPNTVGKDINFISVLYPSDSEVVSISPVGYANPSTGTQIESNKFCEATYAGTRAPNYDEAAALFYNRYLIGNYYIVTSSISMFLPFSMD